MYAARGVQPHERFCEANRFYSSPGLAGGHDFAIAPYDVLWKRQFRLVPNGCVSETLSEELCNESHNGSAPSQRKSPIS